MYSCSCHKCQGLGPQLQEAPDPDFCVKCEGQIYMGEEYEEMYDDEEGWTFCHENCDEMIEIPY